MRKRKSIAQFTLSVGLDAPCRQNGVDQSANREVLERQNATYRSEMARLKGRALALKLLIPFILGQILGEHDSL